MGTVTVRNKKTWNGDGVYIGRPSVFGNPFPLGPTCTREESIARYRDWARHQWKINPAYRRALCQLAARVRKGHDINLLCWCAPLACHGDILAAAIRKLAR